ncbi:MAG TPA: amidohydrolase family protein [Actinomycetota bacterium]|nr:amidohydrolase family protein [Actinomycetota bacterium]
MEGVRAALVLTDEGFAEDHAVLVDGGVIADVVAAPGVPAGIRVSDWGDVALVPGTVNAHGHAFQNLLKGFADDRTFESWRDDVLYPFSEDLRGPDLYTGALFAFTEALRAGATTTVDFFYLHDEGNENAEEVLRAARDSGIRLVLARAFYDPDAPTKAPARYREPADAAAARCRALAAAHAGDPLVSVQPAPHSLHAATPETVAAALEVAAALDVPCHLHLVEARYEREQVTERYGTTPVRLLAREGLLGPRLVTIHTVWADEEELDLLAESGTAVVHCPGANAFLGDGIALLPEMLARGIRVALGPDGGCANNRQSVFDEMRQGALMAKARLTDGSAVSAETAFALGTAGGADVLGLPVGAIAAGRRADLVALDLTDPSLWPVATLRKQIVNSIQQTAIAKVMVEGRVVVEGGRPVLVDEAGLRARVDEIARRWV